MAGRIAVGQKDVLRGKEMEVVKQRKLHLEYQAQFIRVYLIRVAPGKTRHLCRDMFQLVAVGDDDADCPPSPCP